MKIKVSVKKREEREVKITTENIRLDAALKLSDAVSTGGQAKMVIQDELVKVNGELCTARGKKLVCGDTFEFEKVLYKITN